MADAPPPPPPFASAPPAPRRRPRRTWRDNLRADVGVAWTRLRRAPWRWIGVGLGVAVVVGLVAVAALAPNATRAARIWALDLWTQAVSARTQRIVQASVVGRNTLPQDEILTLAGLLPPPSFWDYDPAAAAARLETHPWIESATVIKDPPDRAVVAVTERIPAAVWLHQGVAQLIDREGAPIARLASPAHRLDLPLVTGAAANTRVGEARALLAGAPETIARHITALTLIEERRWDAETALGVRLMLPMADPQAALHEVDKMERRRRILSRDIRVIDLRGHPDAPPTLRLGPQALQALGLASESSSP